MVLATIIRLEMAYPGVGILAGDSLQYLTVVTAHAVIMVFFMIMPLLFGAFANFLLPTQLGVHDVAFPRLNSAAFWFVPAGLLMLCQLVCIDRRYQRMNCFNIREVQTLLRSRYHPDRWDATEHHTFLSDTAIGLRFKLFEEHAITPNMLLSFEHGIGLTPAAREQLYFTSIENSTDSYSYYLLHVAINSLYNFMISFFYNYHEIPLNFINISNIYFLTGSSTGQFWYNPSYATFS
jgi:hypothetical protein